MFQTAQETKLGYFKHCEVDSCPKREKNKGVLKNLSFSLTDVEIRLEEAVKREATYFDVGRKARKVTFLQSAPTNRPKHRHKNTVQKDR
ncbi:hypothetical protein NPIL_115361 [Nephila pilipes]|uniref:Uncharacterized protein n=1 Tax=Nephila pilipes TaxID=299642 RepID=A0A8X6P872_NEPPI|nr:hypothetical protein NPIL_115361 [Nephila pilipes]